MTSLPFPSFGGSSGPSDPPQFSLLGGRSLVGGFGASSFGARRWGKVTTIQPFLSLLLSLAFQSFDPPTHWMGRRRRQDTGTGFSFDACVSRKEKLRERKGLKRGHDEVNRETFF